MYGNQPDHWATNLRGDDRLRFIVNALTRLRVVDAAGGMHLRLRTMLPPAPAGTVPWFDHPERATRDTPMVFGHWSTEGFVNRSNVTGLDTGCVWGGKLTALRLDDGALFQVDCPPSQKPDRVSTSPVVRDFDSGLVRNRVNQPSARSAGSGLRCD